MLQGKTADSRPLGAYLALGLVIFAATMGPIAIRETQLIGVSSLLIIMARLVLTVIILIPFVLRRDITRIRRLQRRDWLLILFSGVLFAANLLLLFYALELTSVFVTGVLRRTTPLWLVWMEMMFLGVVFSRSIYWGLAGTILGGLLVGLGSGSEVAMGSQPLMGGVLAFSGSLSMGMYMLIGRRFRLLLPSLVYSWLVFLVAAGVMVTAVLITATPITGYSWYAYLWILLVTFLTQFLGHIPINFALKHFHAGAFNSGVTKIRNTEIHGEERRYTEKN
jgi:drug/metabolite transporter (DMT)-like permease